MKTGLIFIASFAIAFLISFAGHQRTVLPHETYIGGMDVSGMNIAECISAAADRAQNINLSLSADSDSLIHLNIDNGAIKPDLHAFKEMLQLYLRRETEQIPALKWLVNEQWLHEELSKFFPPPPRFDDSDSRIDLSRTWTTVDIPALSAMISEALSEMDLTLPETDKALKPITREATIIEAPWFQEHFPYRLSQYHTAIDPSSKDRTHNVNLASQAINGALIPPMGRLSFNNTVGQRTYKAGYRDAPVLVRGVLRPGIAGGICQVSTNLYNAALLGALNIVRRRPHSAFFDEFSYVPQGLDAAVAWDYLDLVISNPFNSWLLVLSEIKNTSLQTRIYGSEIPVSVEIDCLDLLRLDYSVEQRFNPAMKAGTRRVTQPGVNGYNVRTIRRLKRNGEWIEEKLAVDRYASYPEIVEYGK